MYRKGLLFIFLLLLPSDCKKIGLGGRGGSASRGSSGRQPYPSGASYSHQSNSAYSNQAGAYRPPNQGYPQQPNAGGYPHPNVGAGGYHQPSSGYHQPNYHVNQPNYQSGFHSGTGPGSISRASQWKTALAAGAVGAVGGILVYEAGKAIIKSATEPAQINGRNYYFNNDEHRYQQKSGELVCSMPLETLIKQTQPSTAAPITGINETAGATNTSSPDQLLSTMQFQDGSRPKTVTWACRSNAEVCCGTECCPAPPSPQQNSPSNGSTESKLSFTSVLLIVLLGLLLLTCCCCCIIYTFFRSLLNSCFPIFSSESTAPYNDEAKYPGSEPQGYAAYQSQPFQQNNAMSMHTYPGPPGIQQPIQNEYPSAPGYVYPSQPHQFSPNY